MRARAIMFIQVTQPLRVIANSKKYCEDKEPSQLDVAPFWCRAHKESVKLWSDPSSLFDRNYNIFDGINNSVTASINRFQQQFKVEIQLDYLFGVPRTMYRSVFDALGMDTILEQVRT